MKEHLASGTTIKLKCGSMQSQLSVADTFEPKIKPKAPRAKHMTKMIGNLIARGMHPYTVVKEGGFTDMVAFGMPDYSVSPPTTFSRAIIQDLYESKKKGSKEKVAGNFR